MTRCRNVAKVDRSLPSIHADAVMLHPSSAGPRAVQQYADGTLNLDRHDGRYNIYSEIRNRAWILAGSESGPLALAIGNRRRLLHASESLRVPKLYTSGTISTERNSSENRPA